MSQSDLRSRPKIINSYFLLIQEIIQNAEDAGAKEVTFIFDRNNDQHLRFSSEKLKKHQVSRFKRKYYKEVQKGYFPSDLKQ